MTNPNCCWKDQERNKSLRATNWKGKRTKGQHNKAANEIKQNTSKTLGGK